jgi:hypothetical protein
VAELLHRPLYSVSVGELGTDTNELEKKLTEILEVSSSWNAVILLDEADVCTYTLTPVAPFCSMQTILISY